MLPSVSYKYQRQYDLHVLSSLTQCLFIFAFVAIFFLALPCPAREDADRLESSHDV